MENGNCLGEIPQEYQARIDFMESKGLPPSTTNE